MLETLRAGLAEWNLDAGQAEPLAEYARLLLEKNRVMNLTAITEQRAVAQLHLLDSAALLSAANFGGKRVIDVGTGAGLPGIPLRILRSDFDLTLLDSLGKRVTFLQEVCDAMALPRVTCVHARAEEFAAAHREGFDLAVSRAVASLNILCELCLPLLAPGGHFLAMKSVGSDDEIEGADHAIQTLGGTLREVRDYTIPTSDVRHRIVVIEKTGHTPNTYPRIFAKIKKNPL